MRRGIAIGLFACLLIGGGGRVFAESEYCEGEFCDDVGTSDGVGTSDDTEGDYDDRPKKQGPSIDLGPLIELIPPLLEQATSRPDLFFTESAAIFDEQTRRVALSFCLVNGGNAASKATKVVIRDRSSSQVVGDSAIGALSPGSDACREEIWASVPAGFTGARRYELIADPNKVVRETREDNNTAVATVDIRSLPDLTIAGFTAKSDAAARKVLLSLCIVNLSKSAVDRTELSIRDGSTGNIVANTSLGPLPAGGRLCRSDLSTTTPAAFNGTRVYDAVVDMQNRIAESNEDNNAATAKASISALPDLTVADAAVRLDEAARQAVLSFCVVNRGKVAVKQTTVSIRDRAASGAVPGPAVGPIAPGDQVCHKDVPAAVPAGFAGSRKYDLVVDPQGRIAETDEGNNKASVTLKIQARQPDLVFADSSARFDEATRQLTISFCVVNQGKGAADGSDVTVRDRLTGEVIANPAINSLPAGDRSCKDLPASIPAGFSGGRQYDLAADAKGLIAESDEENNVASVTLKIQARQPDLVFADSSARFDEATRQLTISFCVVNQGKGAAGGSDVTVRDRLTGEVIANPAIDSLPAGDRSCKDLPASIPAGFSGARQYDLAADAKGLIAESDEGNNAAAVTADISAEPDLSFTDAVAKFDEAAREMVLSFCVINRGTVSSKETRVSIRDPATRAEIQNPRIAPLASDQRTCRDGLLLQVASGFSGTQRYELSVDPDGKITESDETNNTAQAEAYVSALPNLAFADSSTRFDEATRRAMLSFCVVNRGQASSNEAAVAIRDSGNVVSNVTVGALSASDQACFSDIATPVLEDYAGTRSYELIADTDNATNESDENDNTRTVSVAVPELAAPADFDTAAGPANEPAYMSLAFVVAAIVGAGVLSGGIVFLLVRPRSGTHAPPDSIKFRGRPDPGTQITQSAAAEIVLPRLQLRGHADPGHQHLEMREIAMRSAGE